MNDEYLKHEPIFARRKVWQRSLRMPTDQTEIQVVGCTGGDWRSSEQSHCSKGFAAHLETVGAPDYIVSYWHDWAHHVEVPNGRIERDAVARELADYSVQMECVSEVYEALAGLSKPDTAPVHILSENERRMREHYAGLLCEAANNRKHDNQQVSEAMIEVANEWHPGAWDQFLADEARRDEMAHYLGG